MKNTTKIAIAALLTASIGLAACGGPTILTPAQRDTSELGAVKYIGAAGGTFLSCAGQDSDNDGYVTCTMKKPNGETAPLLCSYQSQGCKQK
jgi:hypothetical protein